MNTTVNVLQDIELAPIPPDYSWLILPISLVGLLMLIASIWFWQHYQQPLRKGIRQLDKLTDKPINPTAITKIMLHSLQVKRLADSSLPEEFIQRLEVAQFAAQPCSSKQYLALKQEAKRLLQHFL